MARKRYKPEEIVAKLRQVDVLDLGDGFPFPSGAERATALVMLSAVPRGCPIVLDGLAFGALPEAGALDFARRSSRWYTNRLLWNPVSTPRKRTSFSRASAPRWPLPRASWSRARQPGGS